MKRGVEIEPIFDEGHEQVHRNRDPELRLHRVLGSAEEALDSQMLLDPLEKQPHLPALPNSAQTVSAGRRKCWSETPVACRSRP